METTQHRETVRVPVDELMTYDAGDFHGRPMSEALEGMHDRWNGRDGNAKGRFAHTSEILAGGVDEYIESLAESMRATGFNPAHPIRVTQYRDGSRRVNDGHHRSVAAKLAGVEPVVEVWHSPYWSATKAHAPDSDAPPRPVKGASANLPAPGRPTPEQFATAAARGRMREYTQMVAAAARPVFLPDSDVVDYDDFD